MAKYQKKQPLMKDDFIIYSRNRDYETILAKESYYVVGMDPGTKNFAAGIEKRSCVHPAETIALFKFGVNKKKSESKFNPTYFQFVAAMEDYAEWWPHIEIIYIERQMSVNTDVSEAFAIALTYLVLHCPDAVILEINPKIKGKVLGFTEKYAHNTVKKWATNVAAPAILDVRNDEFGKARLKKKAGNGSYANKMDDKADVVCTIEAAERYLREI